MTTSPDGMASSRRERNRLRSKSWHAAQARAKAVVAKGISRIAR
jgi:hypothetical protein